MKDNNIFKNGSGYNDPTAYKAMKNFDNSYRYKKHWYDLKNALLDYQREMTKSNRDQRYCIAMSIDDILDLMSNIEKKNKR